MREAAATPGLERLRLSSLEVNHLSEALLAAMRETPCVAQHLHVPLQSGDDRVLEAMGRRYTAATYLRRTAAAEGFNLTSDVIVGFPAEDERAFENTLRVVEEAGITKVHVFPYSPRPGTRTAASDTVPPEVKKARSARLRELSAESCRRRWRSRLGERGRRPRRPAGTGLRATTTRPGSSRARSGRSCAHGRSTSPRKGSSVSQPDCLFCRLYAEGDHVRKADGFAAVDDINPKAPVHLLVIPERHVETFREVAEFPPDEAKRMLEFVAETAREAGLDDYQVIVNVGRAPGRPSFTSTGTS